MSGRSVLATLVCALLVALGASACGDGSAPVENRCKRSKDCPADSRCDEELSACVGQGTLEPYDVVLQVSELTRDGAGLKRFTFPSFTLQGPIERDLDVPDGVSIQGRVADLSDAAHPKLLNAEVSFQPTPNETGLVVTPVVVESSNKSTDPTTNLRAVLAPHRAYEVSVQPLGEASTLYPPTKTRFQLDGEGERFELGYGALETLQAKLVDANGVAQGGRWVRVRSNESNAVLSSTWIVSSDGTLVLHAFPGTFADPTSYTIEVNLDPRNPWGETIRVDPRSITGDPKVVTIPAVPQTVQFRGSVEAGQLSAVPLADLTFVSKFPVPDVSGDVRGRDWCRAPILGIPSDEPVPAFTCAATVSASSDASGRFSVSLLPGNYDVFIAPSRETEKQRAKTLASVAVIELQPGGGAQQGQTYPLERASLYRGSVVGLDGSPVPNAAIRVIALGLTGTLGPVAAYNRSSDAVTDADGVFQLAVDTGYFDVLTQPPDDSNYPWVYIANREILPEEMSVIEISGFKLPAPLLVRGVVTSGGAAQPGARVDAFAIVKSIVGGQRGVLIGTATSDEQGAYLLKLPPQILDGTNEARR